MWQSPTRQLAPLRRHSVCVQAYAPTLSSVAYVMALVELKLRAAEEESMAPVRTRTTLTIDGMHCAGCVAAVSTALSRVPGVTVDRAGVGEMTVTRDPGTATDATLASAVERAGYRVVRTSNAKAE